MTPMKDVVVTKGFTEEMQVEVFGVTEAYLRQRVAEYPGHPLELAREWLWKLHPPAMPPANFEHQRKIGINRLIWLMDYIREKEKK